ncbi:hypothetical protein Tco_0657589 [Tanacetum coccineum]
MLDKSMHNVWQSRMLLYIKGKKNGRMMLESIENGPLVYPTIEENGVIRPKKYAELTEQENFQDDCDVQAINIILQGLSPDVYSFVNHCQMAKEIWDIVNLLMQDTELSYQERECKFMTDVKLAKNLYTTNYDQLYAYLNEFFSVSTTTLIYSQQVHYSQPYLPTYEAPHHQQQYQHAYQSQIGHPTENTSSTNEAVNTAHEVSTASSQGQASSSTYVDDVMFSFFAKQSNSPQLDNEDLEQNDTDDLEEMDLKWQVAMLTMRVKRFLKKTGRNMNFNSKETIGIDKTKVECYNCHRRGYQIGLESLKARIVVHQKNEAVYEEDIAFLKYDVKFETSSKKLTKLINSKIRVNNKTGLGYDSQMNESEVVHSESDVDNSPVNDRFKTCEGFHAVPPPYTGNYMPSRPDLSLAGLDDSFYKTKVSETKTSIPKTSKDIVEKPKTIRPSVSYWKGSILDERKCNIKQKWVKSQDNPLIPNTHPYLLNSLMKNQSLFYHHLNSKRPTNLGKPKSNTKISQSSGPIHLDADETVYKEWEDKMEMVVTTASSLEAEQDSGSGPRCQVTILGGAEAQTRFEAASKQSNDPPLSRVNTLGSGEDSMKLKEQM